MSVTQLKANKADDEKKCNFCTANNKSHIIYIIYQSLIVTRNKSDSIFINPKQPPTVNLGHLGQDTE